MTISGNQIIRGMNIKKNAKLPTTNGVTNILDNSDFNLEKFVEENDI